MNDDGKNSASFYVSLKAILYDSSKKTFLIANKAHYIYLGPWDFLGGRMDHKEGALSSLDREIKEEGGENLQYTINGVVSFADVEKDGKSGLAVGYLVFYNGGEVTLSDEHTEYKWATEEDVEKNNEYQPWLKQFVKAAAEKIKEREYLNDLKRLQAEFENYKKRQAAAEKELGGYLIEKMALDIIPVMDNFHSAMSHIPDGEKESAWVTGIRHIEKQLEAVLVGSGMEIIEAKEGEEFDPKVHEAISHEKDNDNDNDNEQHTIAKVIQKGYKFGGRVIRPAKVTVK